MAAWSMSTSAIARNRRPSISGIQRPPDVRRDRRDNSPSEPLPGPSMTGRRLLGGSVGKQ